jgi:hypothetical protein
MTVLLSGILSSLALVPAIVAAIRLPKTSPEFDPFLVFLWLSGINGAISLPVQYLGYYNILHYNIWFLADAYCLLWIFKRWNLFESKRFYNSIAVVFGVCWLVETIFFSKLLEDYNSYFRIIYTFVAILMSVAMINTVLLKIRVSPLKNPMFLICCTFVLLNTITVIGEAFFAYSLVFGNTFRIGMDHIIVIIHAICSLFFALIILWIPTKQAFTLQY